MFCPNCGRQIPDNFAFCPQCGSKIPQIEKMGGNPDNLNLEQASGAAKSGFDTGNPFLTKSGSQVPPIQGAPVKNKPNLIGILFTIIALIVGGRLFFKTFLEGGTIRNCIGSVLGNPPECSDCEPVLRKTTLNGKSLGECTAIPGTGSYDDQCSLKCGNKIYGPSE